MPQANKGRYSIVVKNKPGELAKLTKVLSDAGMNVSGLRIANLGAKASIQFAVPSKTCRRRQLRLTGMRIERPA